MESFLIQDKSATGLQSAIEKAIESRIASDPDVSDCYLRVDADAMAIHVMYIEESLASEEDDDEDIALIILMTEPFEGADEDWEPDYDAIMDYALEQSEYLGWPAFPSKE